MGGTGPPGGMGGPGGTSSPAGDFFVGDYRILQLVGEGSFGKVGNFGVDGLPWVLFFIL